MPGHRPKWFQLLCPTAEAKANLFTWQNVIEARVSNPHYETELTERDGDWWNDKDATRMSMKSEIFTAHTKIRLHKDTYASFFLIQLIAFMVSSFLRV